MCWLCCACLDCVFVLCDVDVVALSCLHVLLFGRLSLHLILVCVVLFGVVALSVLPALMLWLLSGFTFACV